MNEKEAREHLNFTNHICTGCYASRGYCEAVDKAKGLEEALEKIDRGYEESYVDGTRRPLDAHSISYIASEALAKYRSEK